jgi:sRNA-binding protein
MLAEFRARWPRAFPQTIQAIKPLARGIHQEIAAAFPDVKQWRIKQAIARFQRGYDGAYWRAVVKGGSRYALDGSPSGEVTAKEQEQAKATLAAIEAQRAASAQARSTGEPPQADADSAEAS